eukprot:s164_g15.t1
MQPSENEGHALLVELAGQHCCPGRQGCLPQLHLLTLAGRKPLPAVGVQDQLPLVERAAHLGIADERCHVQAISLRASQRLLQSYPNIG